MLSSCMKKNKACKMVKFLQSDDDLGDHETDKGDCAVPEDQNFERRSEYFEEKKLKIEKKGKINDLFVFKEDGEEIKSLRAERPLRRRSEELVKMLDGLQMSPIAVMFRGTLLGKEKD